MYETHSEKRKLGKAVESSANKEARREVSKRIKYGPDKEPTFKEITISREQWAEMIEKYDAIENAVIDNMFQCMDFLTADKTFCEDPKENALPFSLDVSLGQQYLTQILKKSICSLLNEKGLKQPQTFAEELWGNREEIFNSHTHMFCHLKPMR
ncbi:hypothetical protein TNCV_4415391 [Trichonephila clavipes]|uniref:Uncharacterized protein n=1 Tax=Trichonephila clavipes TaxID=2585209 RepID=A0A8X6S126_TRICX|nr:hypothetical protein TNCV_4415391 [Trichonephila clavipes]